MPLELGKDILVGSFWLANVYPLGHLRLGQVDNYSPVTAGGMVLGSSGGIERAKVNDLPRIRFHIAEIAIK